MVVLQYHKSKLSPIQILKYQFYKYFSSWCKTLNRSRKIENAALQTFRAISDTFEECQFQILPKSWKKFRRKIHFCNKTLKSINKRSKSKKCIKYQSNTKLSELRRQSSHWHQTTIEHSETSNKNPCWPSTRDQELLVWLWQPVLVANKIQGRWRLCPFQWKKW